MSFLSVNVSDAIEPEAMPDGSEVQLRITDVNLEDADKNGNPYMMIYFSIEGEIGKKRIKKFYGLPNNNLDGDANNNRKLGLMRFFEAYGIDSSIEMDTEAWVGEIAWAILGLEDSPDYGEQNFIRRFITK